MGGREWKREREERFCYDTTYIDVVTDDDDMFVDVGLHVKSILFSCFKCTMQCYVWQNGWKGYNDDVLQLENVYFMDSYVP